MTSRLLIASVAVGCLATAGVGGYLAVRTATYTSETAEAAALTPEPALTDDAFPVAAAPVATEAPAPQARASVQPTSLPRASRPIPAAAPAREAVGSQPRPEPEVAPAPPPTMSVPTSQSAAIPMHPGKSVELPGPRLEMVELPTNAVIGIRVETTISSETARVEDTVEARVTRPVVIDGRTAIPTGAKLTGIVTLVEPGGQFRERARIGVRFTSVTLDDSIHVPIQTEAIYRIGEAPTGEATAKIGASAVVGSILGGVFGGKKGAVIGGAAGAAGGTAVVARGDRNAAILPLGATLTVRLSEPAQFEVER